MNNITIYNITTYNLSKFIVPILGPLTTNEYTIEYSFTIVKELQSFDPKSVMGSFDIESLFNNILLQETIDSLTLQDRTFADKLSKDSFCELHSRIMFK